MFVINLVKTVYEIEKHGTGMHNAEIFVIIWQRFGNAELIE